MTRIIEENGGALWDFRIHPQPTLKDLCSCIARAKERNMRVLHLAGHGDEEAGFIWNEDDAASDHKVVDNDAIAVAVGSVAGDQGPLEGALLNACSTYAMGLKLREYGVPDVVCWTTRVQDPIAREFCARFYSSLVRQAGGARNYRRAFLDAARPMLEPARAGGAGGSQVVPADVNVVQLLSVGGDSQPLRLKRLQPSPQAQQPAAPAPGVPQAAAAVVGGGGRFVRASNVVIEAFLAPAERRAAVSVLVVMLAEAAHPRAEALARADEAHAAPADQRGRHLRRHGLGAAHGVDEGDAHQHAVPPQPAPAVVEADAHERAAEPELARAVTASAVDAAAAAADPDAAAAAARPGRELGPAGGRDRRDLLRDEERPRDAGERG